MKRTKTKIKVTDESGDRKYFTITPRIVKAYSRNPYDFALWDAVKDIAGETGECYLSTSDLAVLSGMSAGQVSKSRKYWMSIGFLKGEFKRDPGYPQPVWHVSIPNLWQRNIEWCEAHLKIAERMEFMQAQKSLHTVKPSHSKGGTVQCETKNNSKKLKPDDIFAEIAKALSEIQGGGLKSNDGDLISTWIEKHTKEWILKAIQITKDKGAKSSAYVDSILIGWEANGYPKTREQLIEERKRKSSKPKPSSAPEVEYDYAALRKIAKEHHEAQQREAQQRGA